MRISDLTEQQFLRYYEARLADKRFRRSGAQYTAVCPFHEDRNPSLSVNPAKGVWRCHGSCGVGGGIVDFEKRLSGCDDQQAIATIADIIGEKQLNFMRGPERIHVYHDANGIPTFRVRRIGSGKGKRIWQEIPDGKGGWLREGAREKARGLYRLPEVITSAHVFIVEGEACADDLHEAVNNAGLLGKISVTTSPLGAGKYRDEYSRDFIHKQVFILPDADAPGRAHALQVAESTKPYSCGVKIVELPGLPEKGDIADWLKQGHTVKDLIALTKAAPWWMPEQPRDDGFFVGALTLAERVPQELPSLVRSVIPCGSNGSIIADPKSLKSFSLLDLLIHLASGRDWLGEFNIPRRVRCALLAREDFWGLTARRIKHFVAGIELSPEVLAELNDYLLVNTREQQATWALDNEDDLKALIARLKQRRCEFLAMDVFRRLHFADESDNTEMQTILDRVTRIQAEVGCSICIVHHTNKDANGTLFMRTRGASVIHGWMEWGIGLTTINPDAPPRERIRKMEFLNKAGGEPDPIFVRAEGNEDAGWAKLVKTDPPAHQPTPRRREGTRAEAYMQ